MPRIFILLTFLISLSAAYAAEIKVGYVDMKLLLDKSPQVVLGREKLEAEFRDRHETILVEEQSLERKEEQLQTDGAFMSENDRARLELEIRMKRRQTKRDKEDYLEEMNFRRIQELQNLEKDIESAAKRLAKEDGYDLLLTSPVIFASEKIDITQDVLAKLRTEYQLQNPSSQ